MNKVYVIGVWGIWVSGIARYYNKKWFQVLWSDSTKSDLIDRLNEEWMDIIIWGDESRITKDIEKVIYSEAVPLAQEELAKAKSLWIKILTYPEALWEIANEKKLIAVSWTHWKSTTSSMIATMLMHSKLGVNALVWTLLKEFSGKNTYYSDSDLFVIEACEYKRSFLNYKPLILVITNIDVDHLDYFKGEEDYLSAFSEIIDNVQTGWFVIISDKCAKSLSLLNRREDISYVIVSQNYITLKGVRIDIPELDLKVPWEHILEDAHLAYAVWRILEINSYELVEKLEAYRGVWRRMEIVNEFENWTILMSDYGHHPNEIKPTLKALKEKYKDKKLVVFFQPHQYSRTLELLEDFKDAFVNADALIIPDIYESRDSDEIKEQINHHILLDKINLEEKFDGHGLENTWKILLEEAEKWDRILLLLWAWNIDNLRKVFINK